MDLNPQQQKAQANFRDFVNEAILPNADQYDEEEWLPSELIAELARRGYLGATLPETHNGLAMDEITFGLLNEELGRGCSSVRGLVMLQNMISQAILKWGGEAQSSFWLNRMATGDVIGAFALTESDSGSDAGHIGTTATRDGSDYILNGQKQWISLGQIADLFLIFAQYEEKLCVFLLERNTPGLTIEAITGMLGVRASMLAKLQLTDCRIPKENLVGGIGFGLVPVAIDALNLGRYSIAWGCVGLARACLEACIKYTGNRKQFGVFIKDHQLIQQMITDMIVNIKAARLLCCQAGYARERSTPDSLLNTFTAKYFASTMATRVAGDAVQIHGAMGCSRILPIQRYLRDAKIMEVIEGTTQIHQIEIAKHAYQTYINGRHV